MVTLGPLTGVIHGRENFTLPHQYLDHHPIALPFLVHDKTLKYAVANPTFNTIARLETIPLEDLVPASAPSDWTIITDHGPGFSWLAILIVLLLLIGLLLLYHFRTRIAQRIMKLASHLPQLPQSAIDSSVTPL